VLDKSICVFFRKLFSGFRIVHSHTSVETHALEVELWDYHGVKGLDQTLFHQAESTSKLEHIIIMRALNMNGYHIYSMIWAATKRENV
jgi:hypothetical protein